MNLGNYDEKRLRRLDRITKAGRWIIRQEAPHIAHAYAVSRDRRLVLRVRLSLNIRASGSLNLQSDVEDGGIAPRADDALVQFIGEIIAAGSRVGEAFVIGPEAFDVGKPVKAFVKSLVRTDDVRGGFWLDPDGGWFAGSGLVFVGLRRAVTSRVFRWAHSQVFSIAASEKPKTSHVMIYPSTYVHDAIWRLAYVADDVACAWLVPDPTFDSNGARAVEYADDGIEYGDWAETWTSDDVNRQEGLVWLSPDPEVSVDQYPTTPAEVTPELGPLVDRDLLKTAIDCLGGTAEVRQWTQAFAPVVLSTEDRFAMVMPLSCRIPADDEGVPE